MKRFFKRGDVYIWITGGFLGLSVLMIVGMIVLILMNGLSYFYPHRITQFTVQTEESERTILGQIYSSEEIPAEVAEKSGFPASSDLTRHLVRVGNREVFGEDFVWVNQPQVTAESRPPNAVCLERLEFGNAYGHITQLVAPDQVSFDNEIDAWEGYQRYHPIALDLVQRIKEIEKDKIGELNYEVEEGRLELQELDYSHRQGDIGDDELASARAEINQNLSELDSEFGAWQSEIDSLRRVLDQYKLTLRVTGSYGDDDVEIPLGSIVRAYKPNLLTTTEIAGVYLSKLWEFLSADPREANAEGGVFPAIFGTVMMVLIMTIAVVPFGVLAALYLREYAKQGFLVQLVRIAVNNLAGVPSIVFGMFGLGFFVYFVGGGIDSLFFPERLPSPTYGTGGILWASLTLALLTVPVVVVSTEEALAAIPRGIREGSLALGATKWETVRRVVIPSATPGIMTGAILAMARGAGEVAPLMITGVVKLATEMPFDGRFPFFHLDRKFMHLGFHIYDVGFQTSNVEANIGMVYVTTLLLILIVLALNLAAIIVRARLKKKYRLAGF